MLRFVNLPLPIIQSETALHSCKNRFCLEEQKATAMEAFQ